MCWRQELSLAGNNLTEVPDAMAKLTSLRLLQLSGNQLRALPDALCTLPQLQARPCWPTSSPVTTSPLTACPARGTAWRSLQYGTCPCTEIYGYLPGLPQPLQAGNLWKRLCRPA